jgi:hypothetical protein
MTVEVALPRSRLDRDRSELGTLVAADSIWYAVHFEQPRKNVDRAFTRDAAAWLDAHAKQRVFVHNVQEANFADAQD